MLDEIGEVCLGTQHLGASLSDEGQARALLDAYVGLGGALLDTAPDFGGGRAQQIVGRWLSGRPGAPLALSTKFGFTPRGILSDARTLGESLDRSLDALGVERVEWLWCQGWDGVTPLEALSEALGEAVASGRAGRLGLTDWPAWAAALLIERARVTGGPAPQALQLEYSVAAREAERDLLPLARHSGLRVLAWGVTAGGALAGGALGGYYRTSAGLGWEAARDALARLGAERERSPAQLAAAWVIARGCVANIGPPSAEALLAAWPDGPLDEEAQAALDACCAPALGFPQRYWSSLY